MARPAQARVDIAGVVPMDVAEGLSQSIIGRDDDDMHMIGHQAVGPDLCSRLLRPFREEIAIERIGTFLKEGLLATVAALRDVMWDAGENDTGKTSREPS